MELLAIALVGAAFLLFESKGSAPSINIKIGGSNPSPMQQGQQAVKGSGGGSGGGFGLGGGGGGSSGGTSRAMGSSNDPLANTIEDREANAASESALRKQADSESTGLTPYEQNALYQSDPGLGGVAGPEDASGALSESDTGGFSSSESFGTDDWSMDG